jgi:8-oxo-dGTP pyrophosphatase MutT (NUDIX family)
VIQCSVLRCDRLELHVLEPHLVARLRDPLPGAAAQWKFAPTPPLKGWRPDDRPATARQAAALILLYPGEHGASFLLTMRRHDLPHHPGQISFPGGGLDPGEDPTDGALREAHEEVGLDPRHVRVLGTLSTLWVIVSNFVVHPVIGIADDRPEFRAEPREVEALIEAPVHRLGEPETAGVEERLRAGISVKFPYFEFAGHHVWGATAMMLGEFRDVVYGSSSRP